ncbi:MAG: Gfo/Idh/MocA family oxidoreductase [Spirochaetales bacterium]|jgi:UDP-N-acetyl-2-amino-2-deoxyglucuronate dehydrogenase|nr:Gfo/Idh/MocA family oxidoreductase [Spirochaetales bacterium]
MKLLQRRASRGGVSRGGVSRGAWYETATYSNISTEASMAVGELRIGVIGIGAIGPSHIYSINQAHGCVLSAVCDVREVAASAAAEEHGVVFYTDVKEMVESGEVDAVTVSTPSGYHLDAVLEGLRHDVHVLVEKPLEIDTARIDEIIRAEEKSAGIVAGVYQTRFRPLVQKIKSFVDAGSVGEIFSGSAYIKRYRTQEYYDSGNWRGTWEVDGGGCLMNQGIHLIDLYLWLMGPPKRLIAQTSSMGRKLEVETLASALVSFRSGAMGVVEGTTLAYPEWEPYVEIVGSRGTIAFSAGRIMRLELMNPTDQEIAAQAELLALTEQHDRMSAVKNAAVPGLAVPSVDMGHTPVIQDFADAIRTGGKPLVDSREARRAVEFITSIYESSRLDGKPVDF